MEFVLPLFLLILAAATGGILAKLAKLPPLLGYIVGGLVFGTVVPPAVRNIARLSEVGTILLLFSIGLELSLSKLSKFFKIAIFGATAQIVAVSLISFFVLKALGIEVIPAIILSAGFSLSSTALVVKILSGSSRLIAFSQKSNLPTSSPLLTTKASFWKNWRTQSRSRLSKTTILSWALINLCVS